MTRTITRRRRTKEPPDYLPPWFLTLAGHCVVCAHLTHARYQHCWCHPSCSDHLAQLADHVGSATFADRYQVR